MTAGTNTSTELPTRGGKASLGLVAPCDPKRLTPRRGLRLPEAAAYVGVSETKFKAMVKAKTMPEPFKIGGVTLWDLWKIDQAFDALSNQGDDSEWDDVNA
jgi:predicted DNA-binding transcriptional regulator AlpA